MKNVTVGIKTFLRPETLANCLEALRNFDFQEIIVADDNPGSVSEPYKKVYSKYQNLLPLHVLHLPFDTGVSASRNQIIDTAKTDYVLMLDDDHIINSTVLYMYDVLTANTMIGGVSCFFNEKNHARCTACDIYYEDDYIVKDLRKTPEIYTTKNETRYSFFDFIPSATLFRRASFNDVMWDSFYKTGAEHLDFYLRHKQLNKWQFAVALDASIDHIRYNHPMHNTNSYKAHREGPKLNNSWKYFNKKFGVLGKIEGTKLADAFTLKNT